MIPPRGPRILVSILYKLIRIGCIINAILCATRSLAKTFLLMQLRLRKQPAALNADPSLSNEQA